MKQFIKKNEWNSTVSFFYKSHLMIYFSENTIFPPPNEAIEKGISREVVFSLVVKVLV